MSNEKNLPVDISFTNEDREAIGKRPAPKTGVFMKFRTIEAVTAESANGHLMITETACPVDADGNLVRNLSARTMMIVPTRNADWEKRTGRKHEFRSKKNGQPFDPFDGCYQRLVASDSSLPRYPRRDKETKTYLTRDGEVVENVKEYRKNVVEAAVLAKLQRVWRDTDILVGQEFYGVLEQDEGGYLNIKKLRGEPPAEEPVVTAGFFAETAQASAA